MKAVIMAGGFGTRIQPLSINLPKPMIPLANRPIMLHVIERLKAHGIDELILLLYHQPEIIKNYFRDGSEFGVHITYVTPLEDLGTAGAIKAAAKFLDQRFLVVCGDLLTDINFDSVLRFHQQHQAIATIALKPVPDPFQYGMVITDQEGRISRFLEKPGPGEVFSDTVNTGIYVVEPQVLDFIPHSGPSDWSGDIFPAMLAAGVELFGCRVDGYWADIGNTDAYLEACADICSGRINVGLPGEPDAARPQFFAAEDSLIDDDARRQLEGLVVLGSNSQIRGRARVGNCIIGRNCIIEDGAELRDTVLWDNVFVRRKARITGAVLGHRVRIGEDVDIERQVVIGDETTIGDRALLKSAVRIWPRKRVESGATVTSNLIWGEKWRKTLFEGPLISGLTNIELTPEFTARLGAAFGSTLPRNTSVLAGRDTIRSSRMLKRSFVGGLLSAGINVHDIKMSSLPVMRRRLAASDEVGGVYFRQSPRDQASTEVIFYDAEGLEFSTAMARNVERIYYQENFRRVHHSEPGSILELPRIYDDYRKRFLQALNPHLLRQERPKVVIDLNHSPAGDLLPQLLSDLGCDVVELNSHVAEHGSGATPHQIEKAMRQLSDIVVSLKARAGFWIGPSGETLTIVDDQGKVLEHAESLTAITALVSRERRPGCLVMPVAAPRIVDDLAQQGNLDIRRCKADGRALIETALDEDAQLAASLDGRYAFTHFQANFDALFAVARILELLVSSRHRLSELRQAVHRRSYLNCQVPCSQKYKGGVMRRMSEDSAGRNASFIDGVKIEEPDAWALVLPDEYRPAIHIITEADDPERARQLLHHYQKKTTDWRDELAAES